MWWLRFKKKEATPAPTKKADAEEKPRIVENQKRVKKEKPRAGPETLCNLCACHGGETEIPIGKVTGRCASNRTICKSCLQRHIAESISKQNYKVRCLCTSQRCTVILSFRHIRRYATKETFENYDQGLLRSLLEKNPEFCWCARPGCGSGQLHESQDRFPIVRCHACHYNTCFRHHCEWHSGRSCEQYEKDARHSDEVALLQLLQTSKFCRCPSCNNGVEKKGGCDHMTCRCKHEFCWRCQAPYNGPQGIFTIGNKAHKKTCSYYRKK